MIMKKLTILSAIIGVSYLSSVAHAADSSYQAEVFATYGQGSVDGTDELDTSEYSLSGAYYFSGVNTKNHPLAEAAFLEKSSNIYAGWTRSDYDNEDGSVDVSAIGIDFYVPDTMLFVGAGVAQVDVDDGFGDDKDSAWFAKLGITPVDGLLVWSQFYEDVDISDHWNINTKYVVPLAGENAINLEAGYEDWDDGDSETRVAADYYFSRNFSLGAGYTFADTTDTYELRARHFFSDSFSINAGYTSNDDEDSWLVGASLRF
jgi:hypothetical protein